MDVSPGSVELFIGKIEIGEGKNQNCIGPSPQDFFANLHQNNPLKLVVIWPVWVLMENWPAEVNKLWHYWRDGTDTGTDLWRLRWHPVKVSKSGWDWWEVCLGTFPYEGIRRQSKIRTLNPFYARLKSKQIEILKAASRGMYQGTLHFCTHETSEVWCTSNRKIEILKINQSFFLYCYVPQHAVTN